MDFSLTLTRFGSQPNATNHVLRRSTGNDFPLTLPLKHSFPIGSMLKLNRLKLATTRQQYLSVTAGLKKPLTGVSRELNKIALQNLDHSLARRLVRSAFVELQQKLDHPLFKMAPSGIQTDEIRQLMWYEENSRGLEIFYKSWKPEPGVPIKGVVCFSHGYGDTVTFFFEGISRRIAASGYAVYAVDHPGFGLSHGLHGRPELQGLPFFILGQSMGGAVTLEAHLKEPDAWDGIILVAPMCKISDGIMPPAPILKALTVMSRIMPKAKLIPYKDLAELAFRDPRKRELAPYNVICNNDQVRVRTAFELLNATKEIESQVEKVSSPLLILHGEADQVTDPLVSTFLYEKASSKDKTLKLYQGGYHSILEGEPDDRIFAVFNDIVAWLDSRSLKK